MKININIQLLSSKHAEEKYLKSAKKAVESLIDPTLFQINFESDSPDILIFLTGGTEEQALEIVNRAKKRFYLLIGMEEQNGYAAACETKARLHMDGVRNWLSTFKRTKKKGRLMHFARVFHATEQLQQSRIGIIGEPSPWLIASNTDESTLKSKLGIELKKIPWEEIEDFQNLQSDPQFDETFADKATPNQLQPSSKIHTLLKNKIEEYKLDTISVECFPLLEKKNVSGCLSLALLNSLGIPAGCEGDICSATSLLIAKALTQKSAWMANLVDLEFDRAYFSHCSVPIDMVSDLKVMTHFETGKGSATRGKISARYATIFRLNATLDKAYIAKASITKNIASSSGCRTMIEAKLTEKSIKLLKRNPLGNHHLIIPGNNFSLLKIFCYINNIEIINSH